MELLQEIPSFGGMTKTPLSMCVCVPECCAFTCSLSGLLVSSKLVTFLSHCERCRNKCEWTILSGVLTLIPPNIHPGTLHERHSSTHSSKRDITTVPEAHKTRTPQLPSKSLVAYFYQSGPSCQRGHKVIKQEQEFKLKSVGDISDPSPDSWLGSFPQFRVL